MSRIEDAAPEMLAILAALCDDTADQKDIEKLQESVGQNTEAVALIWNYLQLHSDLHFELTSRQVSATILRDIGAMSTAGETRSEPDGCGPVSVSVTKDEPDGLPSFAPVFSPAGFHSTVGYFSSGWPVAYLVATVIVGIGILIGSLIPVSQPVQVAKRTVLPSPSGRGAGGEGSDILSHSRPTVGRITGMVDCKWAQNPKSKIRNPKQIINHKSEIINPSSPVSLGDTFVLASGLLEITYDTGAKVLLQGPVTYEVESKDGGFLSRGKLTAKVQKSEIRNPESETTSKSPNLQVSKSAIPHPSLTSDLCPLFSVGTPTATVTDLGTEFGVEVSKEGNTISHVFHGVVEVRMVAADGKQGKAVRLTENESARVEKGRASVQRIAADPSAFVRAEQLSQRSQDQRLKPFRHWQAYSRELRRDPSLLAYYDFQRKKGSPYLLPNVAVGGDKSLDGMIENANWSNGRMPGKGALRFLSPDQRVRVNIPQKTDDLTLAAWVYVESLDNGLNGLLMSEKWTAPPAGQLHWQLGSSGAGGSVMLSVFGWSAPYSVVSKPVFDASRSYLHRWTHLALVYDRTAACVRFYLNGQRSEEATVPKHVPICIGPAWIGYWEFDYSGGRDFRNFRGRIDELAIFGRAISPEEVQRMFQPGPPEGEGRQQSQTSGGQP